MNWTRQRLADVAEVIRGVSFDNSEVRDSQAEDTLPILRAGNIQDSLDIENDLVWVPRRRISEEQMMRKGDIAIAMSSGSIAIVGKTARLDHDWSGSVGAFCAIIRPKPAVLDNFLDFYLRGPQFTSWRQTTGIGLNIKNLRSLSLRRFQFPFRLFPSSAASLKFSIRLTHLGRNALKLTRLQNGYCPRCSIRCLETL